MREICHKTSAGGVFSLVSEKSHSLHRSFFGDKAMTWIYTITFLGLLFAGGSSDVAHPLPVISDNNAAASENSERTFDEKETFEQTYPFSNRGSVRVSNINGSIALKATDGDQIKLTAVKSAATRADLDDIDLRINASAESFSLEVRYKNSQSWNGIKEYSDANSRVDITLSIPRGAVLSEIGTVNGRVDLSGFTNSTKISAVNGPVTAKDMRGSADISTVNGVIVAEFDQLTSDDRVSLNTVSGTAKIVIPSDADATVRANSLNGNISNDFGLKVSDGDFIGRDMSGRLGDGGSQIKLNSVNGSLTISRKKDGKKPKAAVDTLTSQNITIEGFNAAKVNMEIAKATMQAQKDAQKAAKLAIEQNQVGVFEKFDKEAAKKMAKEIEKVAKIRVSPGAFKFGGFGWNDAIPGVNRKSKSFSVKGKPKITINAEDCGISVRGWDKDEVRYVLTSMGVSDEDRSEVTDSQDGNSVKINVSEGGNEGFFGSGTKRLEVFVPKKSDLEISTSGEIRLDGVSGELNISGNDGNIDIRDSSGNLKLSANDGLLRILGFSGALDSTTSDVDVFLEGDFSKLTSNASDGSVTLTLPKDFGGAINSNVDIDLSDTGLARSADGRWQKGTGENIYTFNVSDGRLFVRNFDSLTDGEQK